MTGVEYVLRCFFYMEEEDFRNHFIYGLVML